MTNTLTAEGNLYLLCSLRRWFPCFIPHQKSSRVKKKEPAVDTLSQIDCQVDAVFHFVFV